MDPNSNNLNQNLIRNYQILWLWQRFQMFMQFSGLEYFPLGIQPNLQQNTNFSNGGEITHNIQIKNEETSIQPQNEITNEINLQPVINKQITQKPKKIHEIKEKSNENSSIFKENEKKWKNNSDEKTENKGKIEIIKEKEKISFNFLKNDIKIILKFLIENVGIVPKGNVLEKKEMLTKNDETLNLIFDILYDSLSQSTKTKEEKIKYVLRKCFNFLKENLDIKTDKLNKKEVEKKFFEIYFGNNVETWVNLGSPLKRKNKLNMDEIDLTNFNVKDLIMPFRKKSVNKTMNHDFLKKIFSHEKFAIGFLTFNSKFNIISTNDNLKKIEKTTSKIIVLLEKNQFNSNAIHKFKRLPWLKIWLEEAENISNEFVKYASIYIFLTLRLC